MISIETARQLLDFRGPDGAISADAAEKQLRGAVAVHNLLESQGVAYLADEVGMGKTYVALGAAALFRHFQPDFRMLVIAPRENIQMKWVKELRNFTHSNFRFSDLRVRSLQGVPARHAVTCGNLIEFVREVTIDADRDFFLRLTSFSLPLGRDEKGLRSKRDELVEYLPWAGDIDFDLRKHTFKDNFARAVCCALPVFDLVIVDEGHNLKHGYGESASARNRVLALALGHPHGNARGFKGYGPRARRVLLLSATPLESDYRQLWNQLDVLGFGEQTKALADTNLDGDERRELARSFLIRRVTSIPAGQDSLTKNLYRREWRSGGLSSHDLELAIPELDQERQRLIVALVQKKVSELLGHEKFNNSFQIGMLASFESFLQTTKVARDQDDSESAGTFDDSEQADTDLEREGLDVDEVNRLAQSYRRKFGRELPHPKMDALVDHLAKGLPAGRKALVFVRRVASVKELQAKLEERYDDHLFERLRRELPRLRSELEPLFERYREERARRRATAFGQPEPESDPFRTNGTPTTAGHVHAESADEGGLDSFFAWFFRGEGPGGVVSGATLQRRFSQASAVYSTFFEDNAVARLLDVEPGGVFDALARHLARAPEDLRSDLYRRAGAFLPTGRKGDRVGRLDLFLAFQRAGLELLSGQPELGEVARLTLDNYPPSNPDRRGDRIAASGSERWLEEPTFFTGLAARPELRRALWPDPPGDLDARAAHRERELRRQLLSSVARLGHSFIELWILAVRRLSSLRQRVKEDDSASGSLIQDFLELLETERTAGSSALSAFRELQASSEHFRLLLDVNLPELRTLPLHQVSRVLGQILGFQRPIGGMFGAVNRRLVRQFRMPGYPIVLFTTDLLQEGEDLHLFCSEVYHYGISWMPSSMEQRVGRIDRVNSQTERRLIGLGRTPAGEEKLQVFYPHLPDTVEVLQVRRVLERLNRFLRLMHRDLGDQEDREKKIHLDEELLRLSWDIAPIEGRLESAFPIREDLLEGPRGELAITPDLAKNWFARFRRLIEQPWPGLQIDWDPDSRPDAPQGSAHLGSRQQPFTLLLQSLDGHILLRCASPIADVDEDHDLDEFTQLSRKLPVNVGVWRDARKRVWHLSVEAEVLLGTEEHDVARAAWLVRRVTKAADRLEQVVAPGVDATPNELREDLDHEVDRDD